MPAARITDIHVCPMITGIVPHVGGIINAPGGFKTLIGELPAARVSDIGICIGPSANIVMGSSAVMIQGLPAARLGDSLSHGGTIVVGNPTVLIG